MTTSFKELLMGNRIAQVEKVLQVYLLRGEKLVQALHSGDFERVDLLMRRRRAAFCNLEVLIHELEESGFSVNRQADLAHLFTDIQKLDSKLEALMRKKQSDLVKEYQALHRSRQHINRYQSGRPQSSGFENSA